MVAERRYRGNFHANLVSLPSPRIRVKSGGGLNEAQAQRLSFRRRVPDKKAGHTATNNGDEMRPTVMSPCTRPSWPKPVHGACVAMAEPHVEPYL